MLNDKGTAFEVTQPIAVCIDQFTQQYRELREMSQDKSVPFKDRIEAHHLLAQLSIALVKMRAEVPSMYIAKTGFTLSELAKQLDNVRYHNTSSTNANGGSSSGHHDGILTE